MKNNNIYYVITAVYMLKVYETKTFKDMFGVTKNLRISKKLHKGGSAKTDGNYSANLSLLSYGGFLAHRPYFQGLYFPRREFFYIKYFHYPYILSFTTMS